METKVVRSSSEFESLKNQWEQLNYSDPESTYYSSFEFLRAWWLAHCRTKELELFIIYVTDAGRVVAIAPFVITTQRRLTVLMWRELNFMGLGDFFTVLLDWSTNSQLRALKEVFRVLDEMKGSWDRTCLTNIASDTKLAHYLRRSHVYNRWFVFQTECPYIEFKNGVRAACDGVKRSDTNYYRNKLSRDLGFQIEVVTEHNRDLLRRMANLHIAEQTYLREVRGRRTRVSLFLDEATYGLIEDVYTSTHVPITFAIWSAERTRLLAYYTCYRFKGTVHFWNQAYDSNFEEYRLGRILAAHVLDYFCSIGSSDMFDFGSGGYYWKYYWTAHSRIVYKLDYWTDPKSGKGKRLKVLRAFGLDYQITPISIAKRLARSVGLNLFK